MVSAVVGTSLLLASPALGHSADAEVTRIAASAGITPTGDAPVTPQTTPADVPEFKTTTAPGANIVALVGLILVSAAGAVVTIVTGRRRERAKSE